MEKIKNIKLPNGEVYELGGSGLDGKITNCITEIPQRIKYTLESGTLTIKAGSVAIFPFGTTAPTYNIGDAIGTNGCWKVADITYNNKQLFYYAELQQDTPVAVKAGASVQATVITILPTLNNVNYQFLYYTSTTLSSGTEVLTSGGVRYLTNSNLIGRYTSNWTTAEGIGLPICLATGAGVADGGFASVSQVFNGFGYIGSTVWVDKGVKGLIPNGRNEDGTLRNKEITITKVFVFDTYYRSDTDILYISDEGHLKPFDYRYFYVDEYPTPASNTWYLVYSTSENMFYRSDNGNDYVKTSTCFVGKINSVYQGNITSFNPKQPFRAVDYSDSSTVSGWSMPSNKYINLTLGASATTYTAPANGYIYIAITPNTSGVLYVYRNKMPRYGQSIPYNNGVWVETMISVQKGYPFTIQYSGTPTVEHFYFIYAEGEV